MKPIQQRVLRIRIRVTVHKAIEEILTVITQGELFIGVSSEDIIDGVIEALTIDDDLRLDMIAYLDSERTKQPR